MDQTEADPETTKPNIHQLIKSSTLHILPTLLVHKTAKKANNTTQKRYMKKWPKLKI